MPAKKFTIWNIDGWFVIIAIILIVLLTAFYLSLALVAGCRNKERILVQEPTGTEKGEMIFFEIVVWLITLENTGLISNIRRENELGFFLRMRQRTELFLERLFYR